MPTPDADCLDHSLSTYETKLRGVCGLRKKLKADDWPRIYHYARAQGLGRYDVFLNGTLIPRTKAWKEIRRSGVTKLVLPSTRPWSRFALDVHTNSSQLTVKPLCRMASRFASNQRLLLNHLSRTQHLIQTPIFGLKYDNPAAEFCPRLSQNKCQRAATPRFDL